MLERKMNNFKSPLRRHNRKYFYKYMTAEVATICLVNKTFRWSSPLLFNDIFDIPRNIKIGFNKEAIANATFDEFIELIEKDNLTNTPYNNNLSVLLKYIHKNLSKKEKK